ncbi:hypothetical protein [Holospora curviuscula]|uniref:Uncharacterized protein n=1 Tax=Holospora curviuscula TaxID=1082868 RepID=A0A2S5RA89_9PROT|nr:hypothetical protein [Holospora curviuscula]PPE04246.1 hypothetical protein HCUR_00437 [Holospora curviuscula]
MCFGYKALHQEQQIPVSAERVAGFAEKIFRLQKIEGFSISDKESFWFRLGRHNDYEIVLKQYAEAMNEQFPEVNLLDYFEEFKTIKGNCNYFHRNWSIIQRVKRAQISLTRVMLPENDWTKNAEHFLKNPLRRTNVEKEELSELNKKFWDGSSFKDPTILSSNLKNMYRSHSFCSDIRALEAHTQLVEKDFKISVKEQLKLFNAVVCKAVVKEFRIPVGVMKDFDYRKYDLEKMNFEKYSDDLFLKCYTDLKSLVFSESLPSENKISNKIRSMIKTRLNNIFETFG